MLDSENKINKKIRISKAPEDRKQEIIDTALDLFAQKGYTNTTIQDIAAHIGISQGLCYRYFKSKSDIFAAASEQYAFSAVQKLDIPFEKNMGSIQKLNFLLKEMYQYIIKSSEFDEIYYSEGKEKVSSEVQLGKIKNFANQLSSVLSEIIKQGIQENEMSCSDVDGTSKFLAYGMIYTFHMRPQKEKDSVYAIHFIICLKNLLQNSLQIKANQETDLAWFDREINR